ncbi:MAG: hypothetical protein V7K92_11465 [Nostoc sp.]|uniref:hypothetical protein n=1 Tax=Nostoc sp. TaxID=1180 RepID=UPI002FF293A3
MLHLAIVKAITLTTAETKIPLPGLAVGALGAGLYGNWSIGGVGMRGSEKLL